MSMIQALLTDGMQYTLGWTLLHSLWLGTAVALGLAVVLRGLRGSSANKRYVAGCVAMIVLIGTVAVCGAIVYQSRPVTIDTPVANWDAVETVSDMEMSTVVVVDSRMDKVVSSEGMWAGFKRNMAVFWGQTMPYCVDIWVLGVVLLGIWNMGGYYQLCRLRRMTVRLTRDDVLETVGQLSKRLGVKKAVNVLESALVQVPTVVGVLKPVILVPTSALTQLPGEYLEALLAHEIAHIRRYDTLVNLLQAVVETLGFYHPAVWWISLVIRHERELCCDDLAIGVTEKRLEYAHALMEMEMLRNESNRMAVAANGGRLFSRISRLVETSSSNRDAAKLSSIVVIVLLVGLFAMPALYAVNKNSSVGMYGGMQIEESDDIRSYDVNKNVQGFGEDDFSTPEAAYAAINLRTARDGRQWPEVTVKRLNKRMAGYRSGPDDPSWAAVKNNAQIKQVSIYKDRYAIVLAQLEPQVVGQTIQKPIDVRHLEKQDGMWLNAGNDRVNSIDEGKVILDKVIKIAKDKELVEPESNMIESQSDVTVYDIKKNLSEFGENDFSTPEAAYAAINLRTSKDSSQWPKVSIDRLAKRMAGDRNGPVSASWAAVLQNADVERVYIYKDNTCAMVLARLEPQEDGQIIRKPIDVRLLEKQDGKWLNSGNNRINSLEEGNVLLAKVMSIDEVKEPVMPERNVISARPTGGSRMPVATVTESKESQEKADTELMGGIALPTSGVVTSGERVFLRQLSKFDELNKESIKLLSNKQHLELEHLKLLQEQDQMAYRLEMAEKIYMDAASQVQKDSAEAILKKMKTKKDEIESRLVWVEKGLERVENLQKEMTEQLKEARAEAISNPDNVVVLRSSIFKVPVGSASLKEINDIYVNKMIADKSSEGKSIIIDQKECEQLIKKLQKEQDVKLLSVPKVKVLSGEQGTISIQTEIPVPTEKGGIGGEMKQKGIGVSGNVMLGEGTIEQQHKKGVMLGGMRQSKEAEEMMSTGVTLPDGASIEYVWTGLELTFDAQRISNEKYFMNVNSRYQDIIDNVVQAKGVDSSVVIRLDQKLLTLSGPMGSAEDEKGEYQILSFIQVCPDK